MASYPQIRLRRERALQLGGGDQVENMSGDAAAGETAPVSPERRSGPEDRGAVPADRAAWAVSGGTSRRAGYCSTEIKPPLSLAWTFDQCGWITGGIVAAGSTAVFGDRAGKLFAVDVRDGRMLWEYELRGLSVGTPAILGNHVFVGSSALAVCVDLATGREVWTSRTRRMKESGSDASEGGCALSISHRVFLCDERLAILDASDGRVGGGMQADFEPRCHTGACSHKEFVYLPTRREIRRLSLSTGTVDGTVSVEEKVTAGPVVGGGLLLYGTSRSTLEAVDLRTLGHAWTFLAEGRIIHEGTGRDVESRPVVSRNRVFFGGPDGCLYALKVSDGTKLWKYGTRDRLEGPPLACGEIVYILAARGEFCALSAADGKVLWKHDAGRRILRASCAPAVAGKHILVGWDKLYAFEPAEEP